MIGKFEVKRDDIINQLAILLIICGVVISGCSEAVDSTYSESSETRTPTLHLVVDSLQYSESSLFQAFQTYREIYGSIERFYDIFHLAEVRKENDDVARIIFLSCHVQSDFPVEYDTFVLVEVERLKHKNGRMDTTELVKWSEFAVILAGETQSEKLTYASGIARATNPVPMVLVTLPPAHERAKELPTRIRYTDTAGRDVKKELLVEYPFNPYNVGGPTEIRVKWRKE